MAWLAIPFLKSAGGYLASKIALNIAPQVFESGKKLIGDLSTQEGRLGDIARYGIGMTIDAKNMIKESFQGAVKNKQAKRLVERIGKQVIALLPTAIQEDAQDYLDEGLDGVNDWLQEPLEEIEFVEDVGQEQRIIEKISDNLIQGANKKLLLKGVDPGDILPELQSQLKKIS